MALNLSVLLVGKGLTLPLIHIYPLRFATSIAHQQNLSFLKGNLGQAFLDQAT